MKHILLTTTLLATFVLAACTTPASASTSAPISMPTSTLAANNTNIDEEAEVRNLVEGFGQRLKLVSLLAPSATQDLQKQYSEFVSPTLLETWMKDVPTAPGRMVSSPWPDRIEITTLAREAANKYVVDGFVVEITSVEVVNGGAANKI